MKQYSQFSNINDLLDTRELHQALEEYDLFKLRHHIKRVLRDYWDELQHNESINRKQFDAIYMALVGAYNKITTDPTLPFPREEHPFGEIEEKPF